MRSKKDNGIYRSRETERSDIGVKARERERGETESG